MIKINFDFKSGWNKISKLRRNATNHDIVHFQKLKLNTKYYFIILKIAKMIDIAIYYEL